MSSNSRKGVPNKRPPKSWVYDQLVERNFDFLDEFIELYRQAEPSQKIHLLSVISEFCLPKQRPVDIEGETASGAFIDVTPAVTDAQLIMLAKRTFVSKDET